jgi:hypothetical protein
MRKQASESPEIVSRASGRPSASPERRWTVPFQGAWPCRAGTIGQPAKAKAGLPTRAAAAATCRERGWDEI